MPRNPDVPCAVCGSLMWRGTGSLPEGQAMCRPCRRVVGASAAPKRSDYRTPCVTCGGPAYGVHCRACANDLKLNVWQAIIRSEDDSHTTRCRREQAAPGLTTSQRTTLLRKWKKQSRSCAYCPRPADTIDHVVPLVRGGTNCEGNLAPCCRSCNGSKGGYMIAEWRHGKRLPPRTEPLPWRAQSRRYVRQRGPKFGAQLTLFPAREAQRKPRRVNQCAVCGSSFTPHQNRANHKFCSVACRKQSPEFKAARTKGKKHWRQTPAGREARRRQKAAARKRRRALQAA